MFERTLKRLQRRLVTDPGPDKLIYLGKEGKDQLFMDEGKKIIW